jgi:uncharacterized membrane protein YeaQ/YmgE (transglycosylase-associated protein family)
MDFDLTGLVTALICGGISGWLARLVLGGAGGIIRNVVLGVIGSVVGLSLLPRLHLSLSFGSPLLEQIVYSTLGAIIVLIVARFVAR